MTPENKKLMDLAKVIKQKLKRAKEKKNDLEQLVDSGSASSRQKQEYVQLKAQIETLEDVIDLIEGMSED